MSRIVPILLYHSIAEDFTPMFSEWTISPKAFADQMFILLENQYTPITVSRLITAMNDSKERLPDRPVVITFDDGFADFYTEVFPILKQYGFPATLYVSTGLIGGTNHWLHKQSKKKMLTWDQIIELSENGIECGSHSHSHLQLDIQSSAVARREIFYSKEVLEKYLSRQISTFSYPHGYHSSTVLRLVREAGYTSACAVKHAMSSTTEDPFALSRIIITADSDENNFKRLLVNRDLGVVLLWRKQIERKLWRLCRWLMFISKRPTSFDTQ